MSIKVINGRIRRNGKVYPVGTVISGLSKNEEARLISLGSAEGNDPVVEEEINADDQQSGDSNGAEDNAPDGQSTTSESAKIPDDQEQVSESGVDPSILQLDTNEYVEAANKEKKVKSR